jgi:hypothetical protein
MSYSCLVCGEKMKKTGNATWECTECHAEATESCHGGLAFDGEYFDDYGEDDGDIPVGCRACGGDYPNCKDSCPMFDD